MRKGASSQDEPLGNPVSSRTRSALHKPAAKSSHPSHPPSNTSKQRPPAPSNGSSRTSALEKTERNPQPNTSQPAPKNKPEGPSASTLLEKQNSIVQTNISQCTREDFHKLFPSDGAETSRQASSSARDSHFTNLFRQVLRAQYSWIPPLQEDSTQHISDFATGNPLVFFNEEQLSQEARGRSIESLRLDLRGDEQTFKLSDSGVPYPFRGHGPIWHQNSCSLDCCIVAARLLNVGLTEANTDEKPKEAWLNSLDKLPRAFIRLLSEPWESLDRQINIDTRHRFWNHELPQLTPGKRNGVHFASASRVWDLCTQQMGQFAFHSRDIYTDCQHCGSTAPDQIFQPQQSLSLDITKSQVDEIEEQHQGNNPTMAQLIEREFSTFPKRCGKCKAPAGRTRRREIQGDLPLRLVVVPGEFTKSLVTKATSNNVRFKYNSTHGEQTAAYRWLGGIYHAHQHFRLYWTDHKGNQRKIHIKVYDGLCASGAIVGGIPVPAANKDDRVPEYWSKSPVVLFYERISEDGVNHAEDSTIRQLAAAISLEKEGALAGAVTPLVTEDQEFVDQRNGDDGLLEVPIYGRDDDESKTEDNNMPSVDGPSQYDGADHDREGIIGMRRRRGSSRISEAMIVTQMPSGVIRKRRQESWGAAGSGAADKRGRYE
ncbi:MAG: hypothetical protein Q9174_005338 [Haloplaca sp. 1 TL-2023]